MQTWCTSQFPALKCGSPAVVPRPFTSPSISFTGCKSSTSSFPTNFFPQRLGVTHCLNISVTFEKMGVVCLSFPSTSCTTRLPPIGTLTIDYFIFKSYTYNNVILSIPSTTPVDCIRYFCITHNSFYILPTEDDSDSESDSNYADSILLTYKTLLTHCPCIYRGNLTPDGHLHGFGTMHYKIDPFSKDFLLVIGIKTNLRL